MTSSPSSRVALTVAAHVGDVDKLAGGRLINIRQAGRGRFAENANIASATDDAPVVRCKRRSFDRSAALYLDCFVKGDREDNHLAWDCIPRYHCGMSRANVLDRFLDPVASYLTPEVARRLVRFRADRGI